MKHSHLALYVSLAAVLILGASTSYLAWKYAGTRSELINTTDDLSMELSQERSNRTLAEAQFANERDNLNKDIEELKEKVDSLTDDRNEYKKKLEDMQDEVGDALKTVGVLDKLSKTDSELLQKYSKVYFLNEHYQPAKLAKLDKDYLYSEGAEQYFNTQALPFFKKMVDDAHDDGVDLYVVSAFRSFETQSTLKGAYTVTYGSGANAFSADQGYSEHQLGTAVDFTTKGIGGGLTSGFETTPAYEWLTENAYKYGFVLSYPKGNAYYVYEPWHWRFVSEKLARDLHKQGKYFYDLDQREIDKYLVSLFD